MSSDRRKKSHERRIRQSSAVIEMALVSDSSWERLIEIMYLTEKSLSKAQLSKYGPQIKCKLFMINEKSTQINCVYCCQHITLSTRIPIQLIDCLFILLFSIAICSSHALKRAFSSAKSFCWFFGSNYTFDRIRGHTKANEKSQIIFSFFCGVPSLIH